jgi:hypothetical protein
MRRTALGIVKAHFTFPLKRESGGIQPVFAVTAAAINAPP